MKEFAHIIRQIFMSTRVIENRVKYQFLGVGCCMIHFMFTVLMYIGQVPLLCGMNVIATLFYAFLAFSLVKREKYRELFIAAMVEVEVNAAVSSIVLGDGYEFMIYTLCLIPGAFYLANTWPAEYKNKYGISWIPINATLVVGIMYILVDVVNSIVPPLYDEEKIVRLRPVFHYFNIMVAVILLLAFSILFALEVRYVQKLLHDENSRLGEIASKDPLTKAYNRRSFYNIINEEIEKDDCIKFGLIILDIDDFKKVNDTYGHVVGDKVLVKVAAVLKESLRETDHFCRWGGEEFLMMIHGNEEDYGIVAERIRSSIEKQVFIDGEEEFSVTSTMGIAEYQTGIQIRTLVDMADQKLYYGKKHGKNQVVK